MQVAALTGSVNTPSSRFRVRQLIPALREHDVEVVDRPTGAGRFPPAGLHQRLIWAPRAMASAATRVLRSRDADVVLLQRELVSTLKTFEGLIGPPVVFDVDDAIFLNQRFGSVARIAASSQLIICGNAHLADWFSVYGPTTVIPTVVDTDRYAPSIGKARRDGLPTVIGWMGTSGNLPEVDRILPALRTVLDARPGAILRVVCDNPRRFGLSTHPRVQTVPWSHENEISELRKFDIGIMPLVDSDWTRGKCGFKLLTYLACGVACVASPVGVNSEILQQNDASLAISHDDWVDRLTAMIDSPGLRSTTAESGRQHVERHYSVDAAAPLMATALRSVL